MIHNALSLNILRPVDLNKPSRNRQAYIIQTPDDMRLFALSDTKEFSENLIFTQPVYSPILALKRIRVTLRGGIQQDFLFMMTVDLKLHLLHFNRSKQILEIISTYKIDMHIIAGFSGAGK
jgi:hypothetical protein